MNRLLLIFLLTLVVANIYGQNNAAKKFNLNFEEVENGLPIGWSTYGDSKYTTSLDSSVVQNGKYAVSIEFNGNAHDYCAWEYSIPNQYKGKKITLSGYIKTENVTDGFAGLWLRVEPFYYTWTDMRKKAVKGTTDWTKYEISVELDPEESNMLIVFGAMMVGKGKMWLDNIQISIDGQALDDLSPVKKKVFPADMDNQFDQGSGITISSMSNFQTENLKVLGLIWGFVKYYHPNVAKGKYNWDYQLFRIFPAVLGAESRKERDDLLIKWIKELGVFPKGKELKIKESSVKIQPDLEWIANSGFSEELTNILLKVKNAKRPKTHYYVDFQKGIRNPIFKNENPYSNPKIPDSGFRILALYRYWNIIQYYFPYRHLIEEDWKDVLEEFLPKFVHAQNRLEYTLEIQELVARVHDCHARLLFSDGGLLNYFGNRTPPINMKFVENKLVVTGLSKFGLETGLEVGDVILSVNNKPVQQMLDERLKYIPASNYPTKLRNITKDLLRTHDTLINIELNRDSVTYYKMLKTYTPMELMSDGKSWKPDTCFKMINNGIAYLNHGHLTIDYLSELWLQIAKSKGLIIDIRNYPKDFYVLNYLSNCLLATEFEFAKSTYGSIKTPGLFIFDNPMKAGFKNKNPYQGKVVILVNENTQSSAEFHTMVYRTHPNATVVGSTTAGADGNVSFIFLPGGISTQFSGIGIYYPDGTETQRVGIVPDVFIEPTIQGIKEGRDEVLEKAIAIIADQN